MRKCIGGITYTINDSRYVNLLEEKIYYHYNTLYYGKDNDNDTMYRCYKLTYLMKGKDQLFN